MKKIRQEEEGKTSPGYSRWVIMHRGGVLIYEVKGFLFSLAPHQTEVRSFSPWEEGENGIQNVALLEAINGQGRAPWSR